MRSKSQDQMEKLQSHWFPLFELGIEGGQYVEEVCGGRSLLLLHIGKEVKKVLLYQLDYFLCYLLSRLLYRQKNMDILNFFIKLFLSCFFIPLDGFILDCFLVRGSHFSLLVLVVDECLQLLREFRILDSRVFFKFHEVLDIFYLVFHYVRLCLR